MLVDPWSGNYFDLEAAKFMEPIGLEHFFDAFSLDRKRPLKVDAAAALRANARVDWLAMDDDDITKKFPILLEGILQDVFSQRASSAWQGNHKNSQCQCSSQGPVLLQNGETYYNPDANSGPH